ncbi:MAG TPA: chromosome segregation protein [Pseudonocardiaceae bacterium]
MAFGSERERDVVPLGTGFDIVKRGYSRTQVEEHLERLDKELKLIALDRDAATAQAQDMYKQMGQARTEISDLRGQVNRLSAPPTTLEGLSERLQRMLRLAQDESNEIKARAESDAGQIRARAEADANSLRARYENLIAEVDGRRVELEHEHRELMEKAHADIDARNKAAEAARTKLDSDAAARRQQIEEDFEIAMSSRRTESMRLLAEQEATSKAEAERRVREATDEATRIRGAVTEEVTTLRTEANQETTALRAQVAEEQRSSKAAAEKRLRESTEEATRVRTEANSEAARTRAAIAEEQRISKADAEKRLRESTEEANKRRHDAASEAQARLQDATDEAHRRVREGTEEASRRVAAATARVESLRTLRTQLAEQLRAAHSLMVNATPQLDPLPEEDPADEQPAGAAPKAGDKPARPDQRTVPIADNAAGQPAAAAQTKTQVKVPDPNRPTMEVAALDAPTRRTNAVQPPSSKPGQVTRPGQQPNQPQQGQRPSVKR